MRQPAWDQYEVALLVDAYVRIVDGGESRKAVLQECSNMLRRKAFNEGMEIDDTFRNLNGMMWQIGFVECAFKKTTRGNHVPSKLFQSIVDMYINQREKFDQIYCEAVQKTQNTSVMHETEEPLMIGSKDKFTTWLLEKTNDKKRVSIICDIIDEVSKYSIKHRISSKEIWAIDSIFEIGVILEKLAKDKIFNAVHRKTAQFFFKHSHLIKEYIREKNQSAISTQKSNNKKPEDTKEKILKAVSQKYIYGYRIGSVIERLKLREYLAELEIDFDGNDEELEELIIENGIVSNGKVIVDFADDFNKLFNNLEEIFDSGTTIIYYESLFERNDELMAELHIASVELLKDVLKSGRSNWVFAKNFFAKDTKDTEEAAVSREIIRVWGERINVSVEELSSRLSYIPTEKVKFYLSMNLMFLWVSEGVYARLDFFKITDSEKERIVKFVNEEIEKRGYVPLTELPCEGIAEENYELSQYALLYGVFLKCLSDIFCLQGKIITKKDVEYDATVLLKQYLATKERITLDEAISMGEEFSGMRDRRIVYPVLYDDMVRVDEQVFINDAGVYFDTGIIDSVIDQFTRDGYIAIKEVSTFALFPECGVPWNHFVLESYCYRFSEKYSYRTNLFNGRNAGAIVDKEISWDYQELMAHAAARTDVDLDADKVGLFLFECGYMARSKFGTLEEIAERAKAIRKEED